ncbi:MAG: four helix bundle protein [Gammaproteobacteria bacterium]|nr:four helix bundle protein [Gammaproteobacteria bacterium]
MVLAKTTYQLTSHFPREERYGLISQLQRSAVRKNAAAAAPSTHSAPPSTHS